MNYRSFVSSLKDEFISMADVQVKEQMMKNPEVLLHTKTGNLVYQGESSAKLTYKEEIY